MKLWASQLLVWHERRRIRLAHITLPVGLSQKTVQNRLSGAKVQIGGQTQGRLVWANNLTAPRWKKSKNECHFLATWLSSACLCLFETIKRQLRVLCVSLVHPWEPSPPLQYNHSYLYMCSLLQKAQLDVRTTAENVWFGHKWSLAKLAEGHLKHLTPVTQVKGSDASWRARKQMTHSEYTKESHWVCLRKLYLAKLSLNLTLSDFLAEHCPLLVNK